MSGALAFGVLCFSSLLTMINPISAAPVFVAMTGGLGPEERRRAAVRACAVALGVLLAFAAFGRVLFGFFGITIDAFRIAGGILFFVTSLRMLTGEPEPAPQADAAQPDAAVVPLGMPLLSGPGAISTVMVLMGQGRSALHVASLLGAVVASVGVTLVVLLASPAVMRLGGRAVVEVVTRVMGLLACVIGIQLVLDGIRPVALGILSAAR